MARASRGGDVVSETVIFSSAKIPFPAQLAARKEIPFLALCCGKHLSTGTAVLTLLLRAAGVIPVPKGGGRERLWERGWRSDGALSGLTIPKLRLSHCSRQSF